MKERGGHWGEGMEEINTEGKRKCLCEDSRGPRAAEKTSVCSSPSQRPELIGDQTTSQSRLVDFSPRWHMAVVSMRIVHVGLCLALLLPCCVRGQRGAPALARLDEDTQRDVLAVDVLNRSGVLNSLLRSEHHLVLRRAQAPRPAFRVPKRAQQGSRFALSLDVPTSILSVLIDLAKNQDMRTKAAANAELMARIGKRK